MKTSFYSQLLLGGGVALAFGLTNLSTAFGETTVFPPESVVQIRLAGVPGVYDAVREAESGPFKPVELRKDLGGYVLAAPDFKTFLAMGRAAKPEAKAPASAALAATPPMARGCLSVAGSGRGRASGPGVLPSINGSRVIFFRPVQKPGPAAAGGNGVAPILVPCRGSVCKPVAIPRGSATKPVAVSPMKGGRPPGPARK